MIITDLLKELNNTSDFALVKSQIEEILKRAYLMIWDLRQMSMKRVLTIEKINEAESFFMLNNPDLMILSFRDFYLNKYVNQIFNFFQAYNPQLGRMHSKGKFNLFDSLKNSDLVYKGYSDVECAKILRLMETHWIASNQIFAIYEISKISKMYITR